MEEKCTRDMVANTTNKFSQCVFTNFIGKLLKPHNNAVRCYPPYKLEMENQGDRDHSPDDQNLVNLFQKSIRYRGYLIFNECILHAWLAHNKYLLRNE